MIISCRDRQGKIGHGGLDLYIIFYKSDGTWSKAVNMGVGINTRNGENCPQVSPDGKYFFFNRYNPDLKKGDIYWVLAAAVSIGSIIAAPFAAVTVKKVNTRKLRFIIGMATVTLGVMTLMKTFVF